LIDAAMADHERCFGASLMKPESEQETAEPYPVGTVARIMHLTRQKDKVQLFAFGKQRFRVVSLHRQGDLMMAMVEEAPLRAVASSEVKALEEKARTVATEYFTLLLDLSDQDSSTLKLPPAVVPLANFIAANVQVSVTRRQHLLEINELQALLGEEIRLLESELRRIQWFQTQKRVRPRGPAPFSLN
jgi:ATP-dependent Lon protease